MMNYERFRDESLVSAELEAVEFGLRDLSTRIEREWTTHEGHIEDFIKDLNKLRTKAECILEYDYDGEDKMSDMHTCMYLN